MRFGLISALLVGAIGAVAINALTDAIRTNGIDDARRTAAYSVAVAVQNVGPRPGPQLTAAQYAATTHLLKSMVATGQFAGATAWQAPDLIAYAAESGRTGRHERPRPQLHEAL